MVHTISLLFTSFRPNNLFRDAQLIKLQQPIHIYKLKTSHVHIFKFSSSHPISICLEVLLMLSCNKEGSSNFGKMLIFVSTRMAVTQGPVHQSLRPLPCDGGRCHAISPAASRWYGNPHKFQHREKAHPENPSGCLNRSCLLHWPY